MERVGSVAEEERELAWNYEEALRNESRNLEGGLKIIACRIRACITYLWECSE